MPGGAKIVTCCYCGTRAALVLGGRKRHELACASCGAPLHNLKMLPAAQSGKKKRTKRRPEYLDPEPYRPARPQKQDRRRKRKSTFKWFLEEAIDLIEDVLD